MEPGDLREVAIAVSPGHTWITAPTSAVAWFVRETVAAVGLAYGSARQGGHRVDLIIDVGAGEPAKAACEALLAMGVKFRWHMDQDPKVCVNSWEPKMLGM